MGEQDMLLAKRMGCIQCGGGRGRELIASNPDEAVYESFWDKQNERCNKFSEAWLHKLATERPVYGTALALEGGIIAVID